MSESYQILETSEKSYFALVPNILAELLDCFDIGVYFQLKKIAGENGRCFYSISSLAKKIKTSENTLRKSLITLSTKRFKELNGKVLINLIHRKKSDGGNDTPLIELNNIWEESVIFYKKLQVQNLNHPGSKSEPPPGSKFEPIYNNHIEEEPINNRGGGGISGLGKLSGKETKKIPSSPSKNISLNTEKNEFVSITQSDFKIWKETFPNINLNRELKKCYAKAVSLKPRKCWRGFILKWLENIDDDLRKNSHIATELSQEVLENNMKEILQNESWAKDYLLKISNKSAGIENLVRLQKDRVEIKIKNSWACINYSDEKFKDAFKCTIAKAIESGDKK